MKSFITLFIMVLSFFSLFGQEADSIVYFKKQFSNKAVSFKKANYSKRISINEFGEKTTEFKGLSDDKILWRKIWRENEPVGMWYILAMDTSFAINYNFKLIYKDIVCTSKEEYKFKNGVLYDDPQCNYTAPRMYNSKSKSPLSSILLSQHYIDKTVQGTVVITFKINKDGIIEDVCVAKGINEALDKEAMRMIREVRFSSPPKIDGEPIELCVKFPISFILR